MCFHLQDASSLLQIAYSLPYLICFTVEALYTEAASGKGSSRPVFWHIHMDGLAAHGVVYGDSVPLRCAC